MQRTTFLLVCVVVATIPTTALAETEEIRVTPAYVREHPKEWSVKVARQKDGLIQFTVTRTLSERMYLVAQCAVQHAGKLIATSNTPSYGTKGRNTFFFSISAEGLQGSTFDLDESRLGGTVNGQEVGLPTIAGSTDYHFKLSDFARQDLLASKSND